MLKIGQNWGKIANYLPQCSTKIDTTVRKAALSIHKNLKTISINTNVVYMLELSFQTTVHFDDDKKTKRKEKNCSCSIKLELSGTVSLRIQNQSCRET